jgi:hypothetical protein
MNEKQKRNWVLDAVLFVIFLMAFFLEATGLELHQWLGITVGIIAAAHLLLHGNWVKAVGSRFFGKTSGRSRLYFLLDGFILAGFAVMIGTGVIISTWLSLDLTNYEMWKAVHITSSIWTLLAVVIKLTAHWKWIASFFRPAQKSLEKVVQPSIPNPGRREFVKVLGVVGVAATIALGESLRSLVSANSVDSAQALIDAQVEAQLAERVQDSLNATATAQTSQAEAATAAVEQSTESATATEAATATAVPTATAEPVVVAAASASTTSCTILCRKGCSFPGRCRRYTDTNVNGICDRTECA